MFSKSCQYAIQAILYIGLKGKDSKPVGIKTICDAQQIPQHFLAKILQQLVKQKFITSTKGPNGGFRLNIPAHEFKLINVVESIDGLDVFYQCGIGLKVCSDENPCPVHESFKIVKQKIRNLLTDKSLKELCEEIESGKTNLMGVVSR